MMNIDLEGNSKSINDVIDYVRNITSYTEYLYKINEKSCRLNIVNVNDAILKEIKKFKTAIYNNNKNNTGTRLTTMIRLYVIFNIKKFGYIEGDFLKGVLDIFNRFNNKEMIGIIDIIESSNATVKPSNCNKINSVATLKQYYISYMPHVTNDVSDDINLSCIMFDVMNNDDISFTTDLHMYLSPKEETNFITNGEFTFNPRNYNSKSKGGSDTSDEDGLVEDILKRINELDKDMNDVLMDNLYNLLIYQLQTNRFFIDKLANRYDESKAIEKWLIPMIARELLSGNLHQNLIDSIYIMVSGAEDRSNVISALRKLLREDRHYKKVNMKSRLVNKRG